jgi:probable addiction module antidote protein
MSKFSKWDSAKYLDTPEDIAAYLNACFAEAGDDDLFITKALNNVARARGITKLANETNITRAGLYKALDGKTKPEFGTMMKIMSSLGLELHVTPKSQ